MRKERTRTGWDRRQSRLIYAQFMKTAGFTERRLAMERRKPRPPSSPEDFKELADILKRASKYSYY